MDAVRVWVVRKLFARHTGYQIGASDVYYRNGLVIIHHNNRQYEVSPPAEDLSKMDYGQEVIWFLLDKYPELKL